MRQAIVHYKGQAAGTIIQHDDGTFSYRYLDSWVADSTKPAVSLTLPKTEEAYQSDYLFPCFFNILPEGFNKDVICKALRIDADDYFGLLLNAAKYDTIGAITIHKIEPQP